MTFKRTVEDFTCAHCGAPNTGDGYTNHCRACLHSVHVDDDPGDRAATCRGLMAPVDVEVRHGETVLVHRCLRCGVVRRCRTCAVDDPEAVLRVVHDKATGVRPARSRRPDG